MTNSITTENLQEILSKLRTLDRKMIKSNLRIECSKLYDTYGGRDKVRKLTGLTSAVFNSMINSGSASNITLENFITLISKLNIDVNEVLTQKEYTGTQSWAQSKKIWTDELKKEFIQFCDNNSINKASTYYHVRRQTAKAYYKIFKDEFKNENEMR